jgi:anti-sigma B factor antagonist
VVEGEPKLAIEVAPGSDPGPILKPSGEVDIQTSPLLAEKLRSVLDQGFSSVVVDLGAVTFLDSTGLSVLVTGLKHCRAAGGEFRLLDPQPNVRRVLEITGLTDIFGLGGDVKTVDHPDQTD